MADLTRARLSGLLPGRVHRFADQERRLRTGPGPEFLHAPAVHFGDVEVTFLIHTEAVDTPEAAREIAPDAPGIEEVAVEVVLEHLRRSAIERPQGAVRPDVDEMNVGGFLAHAPVI